MCHHVEGIFVGFVKHVPVAEQEREVRDLTGELRLAQPGLQQTHGPRLMCFTLMLDLPAMDDLAASGWKPSPSRDDHRYSPFLFCNMAGLAITLDRGEAPRAAGWKDTATQLAG